MAAYASSYIPTTTASATRAADSLTVTGVTGLDYPLTLYAEFERAVDTGNAETLFCVDDGDATDRARLIVDSSDRGAIETRSANTIVASVNVTGALAVGTVYRVAGRVTTNDVNCARGGTLGTADTSCANPATPTTLRFVAVSGAGNESYGYLRRLAIFSRALSDGELQALTAA